MHKAYFTVPAVPCDPCRTALQAVVAADVELMGLREEEQELLHVLEHPEEHTHDEHHVRGMCSCMWCMLHMCSTTCGRCNH